MKRSKSLTFCSILFFWIAFSTWAFNFGYDTRTTFTTISSSIYSLVACIVGVALWRIASWSFIAILCWVCVGIVNLIVYYFTYSQGTLAFVIGQIVIVLFLLKPINRSIREGVRPRRSQ